MGTIALPLTAHVAIVAIGILIIHYLYNKYDQEDKKRMKHQLLFTDSGSAGILCSNKIALENPQIILANEILHCQYCGAKIKLYWDVRIKEV